MTVALVLHRADGAPVSTSFRRAAFGKDDPFPRHREIAWEGPGSMSAGRISFIGELEVPSFPHSETIVVMAGELSLTAAGEAPLVLGPGEGAVIARGTAVHILARSRTLFVFCASAAEGPNSPGITQLRAGSVRFAAPDGSVLTVGAGDALFVPQGAPIGWESSDRVAKFYVVQSVQS